MYLYKMCTCTLCLLLASIFQTVDKDLQRVCFQLLFVSSAFILMKPSELEGNATLDRASFTLWFRFAVSEADHLCWTQPELNHCTDHGLWSTSHLWGGANCLIKKCLNKTFLPGLNSCLTLPVPPLMLPMVKLSCLILSASSPVCP